jgi:hypothetical protein
MKEMLRRGICVLSVNEVAEKEKTGAGAIRRVTPDLNDGQQRLL